MSEFERKPGAPAWQPGKEYAVWLEANASAVVTVLENGSKMAGQTGWYVHDSNIIEHAELPPKTKRLKPGLYLIEGRYGYTTTHRVIQVNECGDVFIFQNAELASEDFTLPPGYEVLEAYAAGREES